MEIRPCSIAELLTAEILIQILMRLPLESVLVCRKVCRSWNDLIRQPFFADLHRSFSRPPLTTIMLVPHSPEQDHRPTFGLITGNSSSSLHYDLTFTDKVIHGIPEISIVGSCNGLICLSSSDEDYYEAHYPQSSAYDNYRIVLCNPIFGSHFYLPDPPQAPEFCSTSHFGFGYVPSTRQYKAVKIVYLEEGGRRQVLFHVCIIQSASNKTMPPSASAWRTVYCDYGTGLPRLNGNYSYSSFFNGSVVWIAESDEAECQSLVFFDIEKEEMQTLLLPPTICRDYEMIDLSSFEDAVRIGVYYDDHDGMDHLYLSEEHTSCANIWVMEDYKSMDSLTLKWAIQLPQDRFVLVQLFNVLKDGKLLIQVESSTLACYDPNTRVLQTMNNLQLPKSSFLVVDIPNLIGCLL